jgi:two-component system, chemotaxis family, protein-glutamate methylesterase/glutaminase
MPRSGHDIVVIGTSSGGLEALDRLVAQLAPDLPASIFIVQHMDPQSTGQALVERLSRHKAFRCKLAEHGEKFRPGRIYIAPPDQHLLLQTTTLSVTKGARENRYRPSIDPLFRSAAVAHGSSVIGILLTGMLDDGTAGMSAIKQCGGVNVVQDPDDAAYPEMPQSALNNAAVDHCVRLDGMGALLERLVHDPPAKRKAVPAGVRTEALIAERVLSDVAQVNGLGTQVPYNCPNCGGVLWQIEHDKKVLRYRCHTGHSFTASALLTSQSERIEETLWICLRMFEERKNLLNNMMKLEVPSRRKGALGERARDTQVHIERIRAILGSAGSSIVHFVDQRPRKRSKPRRRKS